ERCRRNARTAASRSSSTSATRSTPPAKRCASGTRSGIANPRRPGALDRRQCRRRGLAPRIETTMKIHEYQGKEIFRKYGLPTPRGFAAFNVDEAVEAAKKLGGKVWVVKAQIHAGGRGKGGGVKVAKSVDEVREWASRILGMQLKTHQTGPEGQKVRRLLIEEGADIRKELYIGLVVDRGTQQVCVMASSEVAAHTPAKIHKAFVDPQKGLSDAQADELARKIGIPDAGLPQARTILQSLYKAFWEADASLVEINPLIITGNGDVVALDAK